MAHSVHKIQKKIYFISSVCCCSPCQNIFHSFCWLNIHRDLLCSQSRVECSQYSSASVWSSTSLRFLVAMVFSRLCKQPRNISSSQWALQNQRSGRQFQESCKEKTHTQIEKWFAFIKVSLTLTTQIRVQRIGWRSQSPTWQESALDWSKALDSKRLWCSDKTDWGLTLLPL